MIFKWTTIFFDITEIDGYMVFMRMFVNEIKTSSHL